ncbi:DUF6421 family protein [Paenibacillus tarimensis]|uniref:DUF6421 family protein n=1 Tax=Paenibacillus tarimensis TaxID=416012 RepID=UPI001F451239|nr:DUF6421 family protein [Paenibacillus tarimensis]MCF2945168.1 DUF6421 family protein [Paenibacillus tarimensis]
MPLVYVNSNLTVLPWFHTAQRVTELCNELRKVQRGDGAVSHAGDAAGALVIRLVEEIRRLGDWFSPDYVDALEDDLLRWQNEGLGEPDFSASFSKFTPEANGQFNFFLFPIYDLTYRTKDVFLEACFVYRNENEEIGRLRNLYPLAVFQGAELLLATEGLTKNNIFTLFPENIAVRSIGDQKKFAYFFISTYLKIFNTYTKPLGKELLETNFHVLHASEDEIYDARCAFSYTHDHYHYAGKLPFNEFYKKKTTLLGSFFEETRVEALTYVELVRRNNIQCTMASELVLLERLFRYCYTNEPQESFDTLTNYFFLHYLVKGGALHLSGMKFSFDLPKVRQCFEKLSAEMDEVETCMLCSSAQSFEDIIIDWAKPYVEFDENGRVKRTLFAEWLKQKGTAWGLGH